MKKIGLLMLTIVLALGALGIGYAKWADTVDMTVNVGTDNVQLCIQETGTAHEPFTTDPTGSGHLDAGALGTTCDPLVIGTGQPSPRKDVASTDVAWVNCHTLSVTVTNGYPYYTAAVDFTVCNTGSVPTKLWRVVISDDFGNSYTFYGAPAMGGLDLNNDGKCDMVISWEDNWGLQIEGATCGDESFTFVLLEDIPPSQTGTLHFTITLTAVQWNEYSIPEVIS
jgi:hypothetical protein